jgi:hypothetical protein
MDKLLVAMEALSATTGGAASASLVAERAATKAAKLLQVLTLDERQSKALEGLVQTLRVAPTTKKVEGADMGSVMDLVKSMRMDFGKKKTESTEEETNAKNEYELAKQAQDYAISAAEDSKAEKQSILGDRSADLADHKGNLADEEGLLASETANLDSNKADCETKAGEWDERSKIRNGELEAMSMAVKILEKVANVRDPADKAALAQLGKAPLSLLQVVDPSAKAVELIRTVAAERKSKSLAKLADQLTHLARSKGPFDAMKGMIQKMIFRLMA